MQALKLGMIIRWHLGRLFKYKYKYTINYLSEMNFGEKNIVFVKEVNNCSISEDQAMS